MIGFWLNLVIPMTACNILWNTRIQALIAANLRLGDTAKVELVNDVITARPSVRISDRALPAVVIVEDISETKNLETKNATGAAIGGVAVTVAGVFIIVVSGKAVARSGGNRADDGLGNTAAEELGNNVLTARPSRGITNIALPAVLVVQNISETKELEAKNATAAAVGSIAVAVASVVIVILGRKTGGRDGEEGCHCNGNQKSINQSNKFHGLKRVRMLRLRWVEKQLTERGIKKLS